MRAAAVVSCFSLSFLSLVGPAFAQTDPEAMASRVGVRVRPGSPISVTDREGAQTDGRLLRASPDALTLALRGEERAIPWTAIGRVERGDALWNGMAIGAVPAALMGVAAAGASCSPHCNRDTALGSAMFGAIGAAIGAVVDKGVRGYAVIDGPALASRHAVFSPPPVDSLDQLWRRVRQGDTVSLLTSGGQTLDGRFVRASGASVVLDVGGGRHVIDAKDVRRITRQGNRHRAGAAAGAVLLGTAGLIGSAACSGNDCGNPVFVALFTGSAGAMWGAALGAAIEKHPVVYGAGTRADVRVMPVATRGGVGVAFTAAF